MNKKTASTTFRVIALSRSGWEYARPSNHGDHITVAKP